MSSACCDPVRPGPGFLEATGGALVVGRLLELRGVGERLLDARDRWAEIAGDDLALVPAHDLSRWSEYAGFDGCFRVAFGAPVAFAWADEGPSPPFDAHAIRDAWRTAERRLDDRVLTALEESGADPRSLRAQPTRALLVPFGPIPSVLLACGHVAPPLSIPAPGLTRVRGTDMRERPHRLAVHGTVVASACDWDVRDALHDPPSLDEAPGPAGSRYHLVARYG